MIEDGGALWVLGGGDQDLQVQSYTQVVRPGQVTQWGPSMTEDTTMHCSTTLGDGSVMVSGGQRRSDQLTGSARTEIYNFTSGLWTARADMGQRRGLHSCVMEYAP